MSEAASLEGWDDLAFGDLLVDSQNGCSARAGTGTPTVVLRLADVSIDGTVAETGLRKIPLNAESRSKYSLEVGDLLAFRVNGSPGIAGRVVCYPGPAAHTYCDHFIRFRIDRRLVTPRFVSLAFQVPLIRRQVEAAMVSSAGQNTVSQASYRDVELSVPPLAEQRRIVEKVEALLAHVNAARARLAKVPTILKRFRQSILSAACSGSLTEDWRRGNPGAGTGAMFLSSLQDARRQLFEARNDRPRRTAYVPPPPGDVEDLPELPSEWTWSTTEQICDFITKGTTPAADKMTPKGGVPFIKIQHLTERGILNFEVAPVFIDEATHQSGPMRRSRIVPGDVLMNIVGPPLGQSAVVPDSYPEWNTNQAVAILRPIPGLSTKYLALTATCGSVLSWAISRAKATVGQFNLTLELVRALPIPLPGQEEQHEIVRRVDALFNLADAIEARVAAATARTDKITQAILAKAFRGELVPTEADLARQEGRDYEPASALLARIRATRPDNDEKPTRRPRATAATPAPTTAKSGRRKASARNG
jgi:type I restriction enzyme S subunit